MTPPAVPRELKLGLVGLDTSHVIIFADMLNNPESKTPLTGARITAAWPGGSPDLPSSISRVPGYTAELRDQRGVAILDSPEAVAAACDAVLLTSLDARVHRAQFERIAAAGGGRPVFVDKPFALTGAEARAIFECAARHGTPVFTSSSLRFSEALTAVVTPANRGEVTGADFCGPVALEPTNPGWFWYGIHAVEMLYAAMGRGCRSVRAVKTENYDSIVGVWADGRIGTVRGNRTGNFEFHGTVHFAKRSAHVDVPACKKGFFHSLAEEILKISAGGPVPVDAEESIELIRFIEAANESRDHDGREVRL